MYCIRCGEQIDDSDSVCPHCGFSLDDCRAMLNDAEFDSAEYIEDDTDPQVMSSFVPLVSQGMSPGVRVMADREIGSHISISLIIAIVTLILVIILGYDFISYAHYQEDYGDTEPISREEMASHEGALYLMGVGLPESPEEGSDEPEEGSDEPEEGGDEA